MLLLPPPEPVDKDEEVALKIVAPAVAPGGRPNLGTAAPNDIGLPPEAALAGLSPNFTSEEVAPGVAPPAVGSPKVVRVVGFVVAGEAAEVANGVIAAEAGAGAAAGVSAEEIAAPVLEVSLVLAFGTGSFATGKVENLCDGRERGRRGVNHLRFW